MTGREGLSALTPFSGARNWVTPLGRSFSSLAQLRGGRVHSTQEAAEEHRDVPIQ